LNIILNPKYINYNAPPWYRGANYTIFDCFHPWVCLHAI
jgi:hypothetical protein